MCQPCEPADPTPVDTPKDLANEEEECVALDVDTIVVRTLMLGHVPFACSMVECTRSANATFSQAP